VQVLVGARREHVAAVAVAGRRRREVLDGRHAVLDAADVDAEVGRVHAAQLGRAGLRDVKVRRRHVPSTGAHVLGRQRDLLDARLLCGTAPRPDVGHMGINVAPRRGVAGPRVGQRHVVVRVAVAERNFVGGFFGVGVVGQGLRRRRREHDDADVVQRRRGEQPLVLPRAIPRACLVLLDPGVQIRLEQVRRAHVAAEALQHGTKRRAEALALVGRGLGLDAPAPSHDLEQPYRLLPGGALRMGGALLLRGVAGGGRGPHIAERHFIGLGQRSSSGTTLFSFV
ncbi:unnamed protein product, partial [Pelagomonas calceolata]